jgi:hypothetical protein
VAIHTADRCAYARFIFGLKKLINCPMLVSNPPFAPSGAISLLGNGLAMVAELGADAGLPPGALNVISGFGLEAGAAGRQNRSDGGASLRLAVARSSISFVLRQREGHILPA